MSPTEREVLAYLADQQADMLRLLEQLVQIDSPSRCREGIDKMSAAIAAFMKSRKIEVSAIPSETYGTGLRAVVPGGSGDPVVLMGHMDTVFPPGEPERRPFHTSNGRAYGPGVADMKGGLVLNAFVLDALARIGGLPSQVIALFTVDEEIGSPWSRTMIEKVCRGARAVFNAEPGRPNGDFVTARNGGFFFRVEITGKAAHSGVNIQQGINAVSEAARKVLALEDLADPAKGITVNAGALHGGTAFNIVAQSATLDAEVRYRQVSDRQRLLSAIQEIASTSFVKDTACKLTFHGEFPPMEENAGSQALAALYTEAASSCGLDVKGNFSGGCSDAGFTSSIDIPTLCAVGPVGGLPHTDEEYLDLSSLVPRAQALALAILRLIKTT